MLNIFQSDQLKYKHKKNLIVQNSSQAQGLLLKIKGLPHFRLIRSVNFSCHQYVKRSELALEHLVQWDE